MRLTKTFIAACISASFCLSAAAAVSEEEAAKLGDSLTWLGAIKAGNEEGTIPEYTGGLTEPPANYDPSKPGIRPNPFPDEEPLLSIDQSNMDQHADRLTEGTKELMRRYEDFRIDVFPSHRTAAVPERVKNNTIRNATTCETEQEGLAITGETCAGGYPFPIPKTGYEAMWNGLLAFQGVATRLMQRTFVVDDSGPTLVGGVDAIQQYPYYDPNETNVQDVFRLWYEVTAPSRVAGEQIMLIDAVNPLKTPRQAYQYLPGQRRVKRSPELAYDTPNPQIGGGATFDDTKLFTGAMDKFDFKLVEKKEMYIPYNTFDMDNRSVCPEERLLTPRFQNPECVRWELHRVWVVEGTLKPGERHIYHKRVFYWDEDSYTGGAVDQYDAEGNLYRAGFNHFRPHYEVPAPVGAVPFTHYDFNRGNYAVTTLLTNSDGERHVEPEGGRFWTPGGMQRRGTR